MDRIRRADFFVFSLFALAVIVFHIIVPELGFKSLAFAVFTVAMTVIILIPVKWGLVFTFLYIGLEGFLKIVSNYHPVIHVGADVLVIVLTLKTIFESFTGQDKESKFTPPLVLLFAFYFIWVVITLFNPYSLGLIPSLAGAKVYVTMLLLYFFGYSQTKSLKDADDFIKPLIAVVLIHTVLGIYQGMVGPESVLSLHPGYAKQLYKFKNFAFRPFGLTNLPGGPAVYLSFMFPMALYVIFTFRHWLMRATMTIFLPAGIFLFLLCQVRASLIKMIIGSVIFLLGLIFFSSKKRGQLQYILIFLTGVTAGMIYFLPQILNIYMQQNELNVMAVDRSLTIFDLEKVSKARFAVWPRFSAYLQTAPLGAGFSRIGGASVKFTEERQQDPFFKDDYFFADNFWVACLIEIGIPGMILLSLIVACIWWRTMKTVLRLKHFKPKLLALAVFSSITAMMVGLYASEGILYNPDACFYWFFAGVVMKLPLIEDDSSTRQRL